MAVVSLKKGKLLLALLAATTLMGCADYTNRAALEDPEVDPDPLEDVNRVMFGIHEALDTIILKPVTSVYRFIVPEDGRDAVSNFVENLGAPVVFANSVLQGDVDNSFATFWRFALNSTVGVGGLIDVAGDSAGLENRSTDFGETLAVWGAGSGPYIFLPGIGPGTLRDTTGRFVDIVFNPVIYDDTEWLQWAQAGVTIVDARSRNYKAIDEVYRTSLDPYATFRSAYLQKRSSSVRKALDVCYAKEEK